MQSNLLTSIKKIYQQIIKSFAFIPAVIAIFFLGFSVLMLKLDFSESGEGITWLIIKHVKNHNYGF